VSGIEKCMLWLVGDLAVVGGLSSGPLQYNFTIQATDQYGNTYTEQVAVFITPATGAPTTAPVVTTTAPQTTTGEDVYVECVIATASAR
jgi:hypothetical protein